MISPLAQRQLYQTANVEAVRQAHEVSGALQREQGLQKAADERLAEEEHTVRGIPKSDPLRAEERTGGRRQERPPREDEEGDEGDDSAGSAEAHVDFLA